MKKTALLMVLIVTLLSALVLVPVLKAEEHKYIMATGSVGGTFYPLGAAIAKVVTQYSPGVDVSIQSTGASTENVRLLGTKKVEFGLAGGGIAMYGFQGKEMFSKPYPNIRAVGFIYPDVVQWVVLADSGINSLQDMKGKKVGVGPVGSGNESTSKIMFEFAGMSYNDFTPVMLPYAQSADRFKDRQLDSSHFFLSVPSATVTELATTHNIKLLEFKGEYRKRLQEKHPFYISITIPAGVYKGVDKDVETIGFASCLFTRDDIPADDVYKITKALYEHSDEIAQIHQAGKWIQLKDAQKGIFIPFHEGALKYFKEKGMDVKQ